MSDFKFEISNFKSEIPDPTLLHSQIHHPSANTVKIAPSNGRLSARMTTPRPPSVEALTERLQRRKTEDAETIRRRLERVPMELEQAKEFEVCIVNDDLHTAVEAVDEVVTRVLPEAA